MNQGEPAQASDDGAARRSFLVRFAAVVCGGIVALFPFAAGWGVIIDPWRRSRRADADGDSSDAKFVRICSLDAVPADGHFECPCHKSAFAKDGTQLYGPSRRGLDSLKVKLETKGDQTEILVAFQKFQGGIPERKPVE